MPSKLLLQMLKLMFKKIIRQKKCRQMGKGEQKERAKTTNQESVEDSPAEKREAAARKRPASDEEGKKEARSDQHQNASLINCLTIALLEQSRGIF